jgi:outer membrane protein TolC
LVSFDLFFETAHKKDLRLLKAQQQLFSAGFALQDTEWQLDQAVRHAAWALYYAQERQALLGKEIEAQQKVLELAQHQLSAGLIAPTEVQTQDLVLRKARLDLADAEAATLDSRAQLAEAIGVPAQALEKAKLNLTGNLPSQRGASLSVNRVRQSALTHRPDVAMSLADYAAEEANLALEVAKQYPDIKVSPGYQWDQGNNKWQLGLGADLPIFNQNQGPIAEATARRHEAQTRVEIVQAKIAADVDRVVPAMQQAWKTYQAASDLVKTQGDKKMAADRRLQVGQGEPTEALLAEVDLITAQLVLVDRANKLAQQVEALEQLTRPALALAAKTPSAKTSP